MTLEKNFAQGGAEEIAQGSAEQRPSTLAAWALAARPKTLAAATAPVVVALALAYNDARELIIVPAIACFLFAILAQIAANFINDYADFKKGGGYERSLQLSRELGLYRQDYCGCEFAPGGRGKTGA